LDYPGANVGLIVLPGGAIAVDAPALPADAWAWRQQAMDTAGGPILYVVLTDAHPDRLLCAGLLGAPIVTTREAYEQAAGYTDGIGAAWWTVGLDGIRPRPVSWRTPAWRCRRSCSVAGLR